MGIEHTAQHLFELRRDNRRVAGLADNLRPADLSEAYLAQSALVQRMCEHRSTRRSGYKIALTNPAAQEMLGVSHPVFGALIEADCLDAPASLVARDFCTRIVEVEFAFTLAADVPRGSAAYSAASIESLVASVHPAIEVVDHHFAGLDRFDAGTLAADNAIHGAFVLGPAAATSAYADLATRPVRLLVNGDEYSSGAGDRALGHPLAALAWLANTLPEYGLALKAGDWVTTGLATDAIYDAVAGDKVVGDFGALGNVELGWI